VPLARSEIEWFYDNTSTPGIHDVA